MISETTNKQAEAVASLIPKLMRRLLVLDLDDPMAEMPGAQKRICGILREEPRTMSCLSKELGTSLSATTQIADRLEKSGMVERVADGDDKRTKTLQLTPYGAQIMEARMQRRMKRVQQALELLSPSERASVVSALQLLSDVSLNVISDSDSIQESHQEFVGY